MFIITAKCSKRRVVKILLIFALLLSLFLALRACRHSSPPPVIAAGTNEERIAYLASLGWEVNDQPIETLSVTLGETLEEPYLSYNDLQLSQGFDLTRYCGQTLSRYTYVVTNYPDASRSVRLRRRACRGRHRLHRRKRLHGRARFPRRLTALSSPSQAPARGLFLFDYCARLWYDFEE